MTTSNDVVKEILQTLHDTYEKANELTKVMDRERWRREDEFRKALSAELQPRRLEVQEYEKIVLSGMQELFTVGTILYSYDYESYYIVVSVNGINMLDALEMAKPRFKAQRFALNQLLTMRIVTIDEVPKTYQRMAATKITELRTKDW